MRKRSRSAKRAICWRRCPPIFLIVSERHGLVVGIEAFTDQPLSAAVLEVATDPSGVALGATEQDVLKAHPAARRRVTPEGLHLFTAVSSRYVASYDLAGGRVRAIDWFSRASTDPPGADGPALAEPAGDSPATAILDVATNEDAGIRWGARLAAVPPVRRQDAVAEGRGRHLARERPDLRRRQPHLSHERRDPHGVFRHHLVLREALSKKAPRERGFVAFAAVRGTGYGCCCCCCCCR